MLLKSVQFSPALEIPSVPSIRWGQKRTHCMASGDRMVFSLFVALLVLFSLEFLFWNLRHNEVIEVIPWFRAKIEFQIEAQSILLRKLQTRWTIAFNEDLQLQSILEVNGQDEQYFSISGISSKNRPVSSHLRSAKGRKNWISKCAETFKN